MKFTHNRHQARLKAAIASAFVVGLAGVACPAHALNYSYEGVSLQLDTRLSEGVGIRAENPSPDFIGIANGGKAYSVNADDGNLAYKSGDVTYAASQITSALTLKWRDYGLFARANYTYDPALKTKNFFDDRDFGAGKLYTDTRRQQANHIIQDHVGSDGTMLDLYAYGNFDIKGHLLNVKVGKQVVNWGETTLVLNGLNSLVALDANKARIPGAEIDEFVLPAAQVFAAMDVTEHVSVEGFYQFKFERTIIDATGTYFSTTDYIGPGGIAGNIDFGRAGEYAAAGSSCAGLPPSISCVPYGGAIPRGYDVMPRNGGQFGGALRMSLPALNDLELSLYAANYHSRLPLFSSISAASGNVDSRTAMVIGEYPEDIHMFGTSFNMPLPGGFTLQGEYAYKPNQPIEIDDVEQSLADVGAPSQISGVPGSTLGNQYIRGWRRKKISSWDFGTTKLLGPNKFTGWDEVLLIGEVAAFHVHNLDDPSVLRYEGPGTFLPGSASEAALLGVPVQQTGFATSTSWGYKLIARSTYNNVLPGLALKPTLRFDHDVNGITPAPLYNFTRGSRLLQPSVGFQYKSATTADIGFAHYFGGGANNLFRDRDYAYFDVKYSF